MFAIFCTFKNGKVRAVTGFSTAASAHEIAEKLVQGTSFVDITVKEVGSTSEAIAKAEVAVKSAALLKARVQPAVAMAMAPKRRGRKKGSKNKPKGLIEGLDPSTRRYLKANGII